MYAFYTLFYLLTQGFFFLFFFLMHVDYSMRSLEAGSSLTMKCLPFRLVASSFSMAERISNKQTKKKMEIKFIRQLLINIFFFNKNGLLLLLLLLSLSVLLLLEV